MPHIHCSFLLAYPLFASLLLGVLHGSRWNCTELYYMTCWMNWSYQDLLLILLPIHIRHCHCQRCSFQQVHEAIQYMECVEKKTPKGCNYFRLQKKQEFEACHYLQMTKKDQEVELLTKKVPSCLLVCSSPKYTFIFKSRLL